MKLIEALATLDLDMEIDEGDLVTDVLVIAKVVRLDGPTTVLHASTTGTDGITKLGLVTAAGEVIRGHWESYEADD